MAGYIGSAASVVSSGAEHKKTFTITGATTSLTGLNYTVGKVHVFQNGVRLVDGTDYTATNGTTITLTVAAQSGDNVVVISQADFQVSGAVSTSGDSMTGDLSFGDNDKAKFGAGSDLQIYSDGTHSRIYESGSGLLVVRASNFNVNNADGSDSYITMQDGGAVTSYYDGSAKIATTSTGIAVTGSTAHTAGDITNTISGTYNINGANGTAGSPAYATYSFKDDPNTGMYRAGADALAFTTAGSQRMKIDASGRVTTPSQPAFFAYKTSTDVLLTGANFPRDNDFGSVQFNTGNHYNTSNSRFTAPVAGRYFFEAEFYMGFNAGAVRALHGEWRKNNTATINWNAAGGISNAGGTFYHPTMKTSVIMNLSAGDYVSVYMASLSITNGSCSIYGGAGAATHFSGYLIG